MKLEHWLLAAGTALALGGAAVAVDGPASSLETATFSMYCYWTGEATLGKVEGIVASRIGHWQGREIVQVDYDASKTDLEELVAALKRQRSFYSVVTSDAESHVTLAHRVGDDEVTLVDGKPRFIESKHSLRVTKPQIYALDLTEQQAIKLNSWAYFGGSMPDVLTEEQRVQLGSGKP
ncbi:MAG: hypothetical protein MPN21_02775 [Thermoanaerobaculia bacterium]|nr:hypothetical protein [Thermoanaerobaculia bacterium]